MLNNIIALTKKFILIKSIADNPKALEKILELALLNLKGYTIERFEHNGVKSALVYNTKKRPKKFKILLNGHLDVIPGKEFQYKPEIKGNKLHGVGSMDMKANIACLILIFKEVANKINYPLGLQLNTDEQIGGFNGTKHQIEKGVRADFIITGEPTNFDIVNKAKGILLLKISILGKTAHGAYPWKGENAIWSMNNFLNKLNSLYPCPKKEKWATTVNLSTIKTSNKALNKIPDDCTVDLDIRYIPKDKKVLLKNIKKVLPKGFKIEVIADEPALDTDKKNKYVKDIQKIGKKITDKKIIIRGAQGSSDARHFVKVRCPGIEFGPIGEGSGSDKEWISIPSLEKYRQIIKDFLLSIK